MRTLNLVRLFLALTLAGFCGEAAIAQMTTPTAASSSLTIGGQVISTGFAIFVPVDSTGKGLAITKSGGGLNLPPTQPSSGAPIGYSCPITAGALGSCSVPDAAIGAPNGFAYNVTFLDTSTGNPTSGQSATLSQVHGVTGTTWQLDHYAASISVPTVSPFTYTQGVGAPTGTGGTNAFYADITTPTSPVLYTAIGGVWEQMFGTGGGVTAAAIQVALSGRTGCGTAGYPYVPASNTCIQITGSASPYSGAIEYVLGDSYADGHGLTPVGQAFPYLVATARNWSTAAGGVSTNLSGDGWGFGDETNNLMTTTRFITANSVTIEAMGNNEETNYGALEGGTPTAPNTQDSNQFTATYRASLVLAGTLTNNIVYATDAAVTTTGTWAATGIATFSQAQMMTAKSSGATMTFTVTGSRIDLIVGEFNSNAATYGWSIDGTPQNCTFPTISTTCTVNFNVNGSTDNLTTVDFTERGLSNGSHTVVVTNGANTNGVNVLGVIGTDQTLSALSHPLVVSLRIGRYTASDSQYAAHNDTYTAAFNALEATENSSLIADGFNIVSVDYTNAPGSGDVTAWFNINDATQRNSDLRHPNYIGHKHIAKAILNALTAAGR